MEDRLAEDAMARLSGIIKAEEKHLAVLRRRAVKAAAGSDERMVLALELTHLRTRVDTLKEAWLIVFSRPF